MDELVLRGFLQQSAHTRFVIRSIFLIFIFLKQTKEQMHAVLRVGGQICAA